MQYGQYLQAELPVPGILLSLSHACVPHPANGCILGLRCTREEIQRMMLERNPHKREFGVPGNPADSGSLRLFFPVSIDVADTESFLVKIWTLRGKISKLGLTAQRGNGQRGRPCSPGLIDGPAQCAGMPAQQKGRVACPG